MIQMLKDVNEINIILKIMQTCLQKENKDKNVIIHHLKAASSQQSTSVMILACVTRKMLKKEMLDHLNNVKQYYK